MQFSATRLWLGGVYPVATQVSKPSKQSQLSVISLVGCPESATQVPSNKTWLLGTWHPSRRNNRHTTQGYRAACLGAENQSYLLEASLVGVGIPQYSRFTSRTSPGGLWSKSCFSIMHRSRCQICSLCSLHCIKCASQMDQPQRALILKVSKMYIRMGSLAGFVQVVW